MYLYLIIWEKHSEIETNKGQTVQLEEIGIPLKRT